MGEVVGDPGDLTCRELVEFLADYLAGALPPDAAARFTAHLALCPSCVRYARSYRTSVELARRVCHAADSLPDEVSEALVRAVLDARRT